MLSLTEAFVLDDIAGLVELKPDKVWLLKGKVGDELVIKAEARVEQVHIKGTSTVVKAIDPVSRMKTLHETERGAMAVFCASLYNSGANNHPSITKERLLQLRSRLMRPGTQGDFAKMAKQIVMTLDSALRKRCEGDEDELIMFTQSLVATGGLEKLGQVVAADMFNGNNDRFDFRSAGGIPFIYNGYRIDTDCVVNWGNIFVSLSNGNYAPSLLDYIDPNSGVNKNISTSLNNKDKKDQWSGYLLVTKESRKKAASTLAVDLERIITPPNGAPKPVLGKNSKDRIHTGICQGIRAIQMALKKKLSKPNSENKLPLSLQDRYGMISQIKI